MTAERWGRGCRRCPQKGPPPRSGPINRGRPGGPEARWRESAPPAPPQNDPPTARLPPTRAALAAREVVTPRQAGSKFPGEAEYPFRHSLLREAAYAALTPADLK